MIQKNKPKEMITAAAIAEICSRAGSVKSIERALAIEKAMKKLHPTTNKFEKDCLKYLILGAIYDGGRIQGIREERARRHKN